MKKNIILMAILAVISASCANNQAPQQASEQTSELIDAPCLENNFERPASVVFSEVAERFGITINGAKHLKMMIPEADYLVYPWSADETMEDLCARIGRKSYKVSDGVYEIRENNHARTSPEWGKKMLDYLSSLYSTKQEWEARKDTLRRDFLKKIGLEALPEVPGAAPILSGKREYGDIYIENIAIEVLKGVYCTGSVYHPVKFSDGSCPIILNPQGHFLNGRFGDHSQFLCQMLAKMGCVVLSYDLFAWQFSDQALQYNVEGEDSEVHMHAVAQNVQVLSGIRVLDYLYSLPEADKSRVGVTGASGGGSQTMFLTAIDDRVTVSMPVVMASCYMNGGCPCESGNALQLICGRTCNTEIAAMCAPRPMLLVSDGHDWTDHCPDYDMPYMKKIYGFYGEPQLVQNAHFPEEHHDYGPSKRNAVYNFISALWNLDTSAVPAFDESVCVLEENALLLNWGEDGSKLPADAARTIEEVQAAWNARSPK